MGNERMKWKNEMHAIFRKNCFPHFSMPNKKQLRYQQNPKGILKLTL